MTTACKCDRCGNLFEHKRGTVRVDFHVTIKVDSNGDPTQETWESDLCPKCSGEFFTFVKDGPAWARKP